MNRGWEGRVVKSRVTDALAWGSRPAINMYRTCCLHLFPDNLASGLGAFLPTNIRASRNGAL